MFIMQMMNDMENIFLDGISLFEQCENSNLVNNIDVNNDDELVPIVVSLLIRLIVLKKIIDNVLFPRIFSLEHEVQRKDPTIQ